MTAPEDAAAAHARRVVAGDAGARTDLAPEAVVEPAELYDRLLEARFRDFEVVAHARIGAYHVFKTRYRGPVTLIVQERWVGDREGGWRIHEAELVRVAVEGPA